ATILNPIGPGSFDLYRQTLGFEKTFCNGDASFGVRLPILQKDGISGVGIDGFGDLTLVLKYMFCSDCRSGNVVSGGVAVTLPTGRSPLLNDNRRLESYLFQPYFGFINNCDRLYALGFSAVIFPSDSRDVTFYTADLGVGYRLYVSSCPD